MTAPRPDNSKPLTDTERLGAQGARHVERRKKQASRPPIEPKILGRGEWGSVRSAHRRTTVVR